MIRNIASGLFGKLLGKKAGAVAGSIVDDVVTRAADTATGGIASEVDEAVKAAKRRKR